ncbi:hypothetical protein [Radiobacillus deserti]|uniref:Lipoprotein n=1 Tax=Radiobacillus deserti TaxID=2594883 RepID=A0A516KD75_9BACI|nr:hypothetical protein [Radiobacillus deserti]QDP39362.1 hypothetical protein FN924_03650 [Radiobacillus deserti]
MKKLLTLPVTIFLLILLSACSNYQGDPIEPSENNMIINIKNNANFDFYSIEISTDKTTGGISRADGSEIQKGETLRKEYIVGEDFDLEGETTFKFVLIGEKEQRIPLKEVTLELTTNKEYYFEITGDSKKDAVIKRVK